MRSGLIYTFSKLTVTLIPVLFLSVGAGAQLPTANFSANPRSGCSPLTVYFTDLSTGNPFSWNWDFGNGQLSTLQNPVVTFYGAGPFTVKLVVKNASGLDEEIKTDYIVLNPSPSAAFSSNATVACVPATIQFTDQSTSPAAAGPIVSWLWNFGDGTTSTQQNPSHTYSGTGYFNVSLVVTSSSGCQNGVAIGKYIKILNGVDADFSWSQPSTCQPPFTISLSDQTSGPGNLTWSWNFGNGTTSSLQYPATTFTTAGTYAITLQVQSSFGCKGTVTKNVPVTGRVTDFSSLSPVCVGQNVTFQNSSSPSPVSSFWKFGDGTTSSQINPIKTYLNTGNFSVKLINNYGNCIDSVTKSIAVISKPPINFTANDSSSCQAPFAVQFSDLSPGTSTWLWNFGDGTTSTQKNPLHIYNAAGSYNVSLTISLPGGCSNTITKTNYVNIIPTTVSISNAPAGGCVPFTFSPVPVIQTVDDIISYTWDMGEPAAIYPGQYPTHTYNSAGNYNIRLTVKTQNGCTSTYDLPNAVRTGTPPTVNFNSSPDNVCASTPIQFTDLSTTSPGAVVSWQWKFGDGATSTEQNPTHIYQDTGSLISTLIVSNNGCKDSITKSVNLLIPVAKFGYKVNCNNRLQVTFLDSSLVNPAYGSVTYEWRMGDPANTVFIGKQPAPFSYPSYGTYTATLIVTNGSCTYKTTKQIVLVDENPGLTINKNPVCKNELFTLTAVVPDSTRIVDYTWMIANTTLSDTTRTANYSLAANGNYDVTVTTKNSNGCFNSTTIRNFITVRGPAANFSVNGPGACVNGTMNFTDQSTGASSIKSWTWNYGDGTQQTYTSPPFSHTYLQTGSYTVSLIITDNASCVDTATKPNSVLITDPVAAFRADSFYCPLAPLQFSDTSYGNGLSYLWNFGDGMTSTLQNPTHAYPKGNNVYTVKLKITDLVGCQDSITKQNYIKIRRPQPSFTMQDSTGICLPTVINFTFQGQDYESFYWTFGDGTRSTAQNPPHFYNSYGTYIPKLFLIGPGGCIDSAEEVVNIYDPSLTRITSSGVAGCHTVASNFSITPPPGFRFKFYFGDGQVDSSQQLSLTHTYDWPGNYTPYVILFDNYGCESGVYSNTIHVYGALPVFSMPQKEFCDSGKVFFINHSLWNDPIVSTVWNFDDGTTSNETEPSHIFSPPGYYYVTLTLTTQQQCTATSKDTVRIFPTPNLNIRGKDSICINNHEQYTAIVAQLDPTLKWQWTFGNGSSGQSQNPFVVYSDTGNYNIQLIGTNKLGCADTTSFPVYVVPLPTAKPVADPQQIISGGATQLMMNYTGPVVSYAWQPQLALNCYSCPAPIANPQFTTKYKVDIVDRFGCKNQGYVTVKVLCTNQNFFVPNSFSPNGDGVNDIFYLRGTGLFRVKALRVFNRWGELVFEKTEVPVNNPSYGWDGMYKGTKAKADVYIYQVEIICSNGEVVTHSGNVALIL